MSRASYPTPEHERACKSIVEFFSQQQGVQTILLVNSCARGKASRDSCLDLIVLVSEGFRDRGYLSRVLERGENLGTDHLYRAWQDFHDQSAVIGDLHTVGRFSEIHLDISDGLITPGEPDRDQAIDHFEMAIGNYFVYSQPLWDVADRFQKLRADWLPYYSDSLRDKRLSATRTYCHYQLDHIQPYTERGLYFQAFDRLYQAFQGFLQGLFISRRVYPIAYNKWIREQVNEILGLPELYARLPDILQIGSLQSPELVQKGETLRRLVAEYLVD